MTARLYYVKTGLAGYGPDLDPDDEPCSFEDLDSVISDELSRAADFAEETAHALADSGDYESAWREHERSDSLACLSANFDPARRSAPLYKDNLPLWFETVERMLADFPVDIGNHERLYVWESDES